MRLGRDVADDRVEIVGRRMRVRKGGAKSARAKEFQFPVDVLFEVEKPPIEAL